MADEKVVTRAFRFAVDPSTGQERLLRSYCGAGRFAYNHALAEVTGNLAVRTVERDAGVAEAELTPALSWSAFSIGKRWNAVKADAAPWWREVSMHAFRSGTNACAAALKNWSESSRGARKGRRVGFPSFKSKHRSKLSVSFVEINHQLSWLHGDRHHVRLMLPASMRSQAKRLEWVHVHGSTRRLSRLVETGRATIQKVTFSYGGGRWWVSIAVRIAQPVATRGRKRAGDVIAVDVGLKHLATLSQPVECLTDEHGHVPNPQVLRGQLRRLRKLDKALARAHRGSRNHRMLKQRRARLHGRIAQTRALHLHRLSSELAARFATVVVEDLNVQGMGNRNRRLGRALADASIGELRRQLGYKTVEHGHQLVVVDRWFPSSKTCSSCGSVKAKLELWERTYTCDTCGSVLDRDMNAALNLEVEGRELLAGIRPASPGEDPQGEAPGEGDPRPDKTAAATAALAA